MPDESNDDKTEEATPYKLQKEREKGNVAKSKDMASAMVLLMSMLLLYMLGDYMLESMGALTIRFLQTEIAGNPGNIPVPSQERIVALMYQWMIWSVIPMAPFLVLILIGAMLAHVVQTGPMYAPEALKLDLTKLNPIAGFKRMFSLKSFMTLLMNMGKLLIVVVVVWLTLREEVPTSMVLARSSVGQMTWHGGNAVFELGLRLAMIFFILGVVDFMYQRYQHAQNLKMTKQEVKDEYKMQEGDPHIRARRRQIQREMSQQRMMQEVPESEVVVRNPTHYAVAIRYKPELAAPVVVAKGKGKMAMRILDRAMAAGVPTWRDPPLARQLYKIEVGDPIPPALFQALAEILAHVLTAEKRAQYLSSMAGAA